MTTPTHWWIVDPAGHRRLETTSVPEVPPGWEDLDNVVILNLAASLGDTWVCDNCNDEIPPAGPIPVLNGNALCDPCAIKTGLRGWDGAPVCGCPACTAYAVRALGSATVEALRRQAPWN